MTNHEIELELRKLLRSKHRSRALLCDGSPIGCKVAIVGVNPATDISLWRYWNKDSGCNKVAWLAEFRRKWGHALKPTRRGIEYLIEELKPVRCIELNVYPYVSGNEKQLPAALKDVRVFDFLLRKIEPRLLFVFGNTAIKELQKLLQLPALPKNVYTSCTYQRVRFNIYATSHLSRGWSQVRVRELGRAFAKHLDSKSR